MRFTPGCKCCCAWRIITNGCSDKTLAGATVDIYRASDPGTLIATGTSAFGMISAINMSAFGSGYTSTPTLSLTGATGTGEVFNVLMRLNTITRTSGGSGYTNGFYTNGTFTGGGGTGGTFSYTVTGGVVQSTLTITGTGSGYTSAPTPVFNAGPGTGAAATTTLRVLSVVVVDGGTGHTLPAPTVVFSGGGGSGATANAVVSAYARFEGISPGDYIITLTPPAGYDFQVTSGNRSLACAGISDTVTTITLAPQVGFECRCQCVNPFPVSLYIEDDYAPHTLALQTPPSDPNIAVWTVEYLAPVTAQSADAGIDPTCHFESATTRLTYTLRLLCTGDPGTAHWEFTITFGTDCCGPTFPTQVPVYSNIFRPAQAIETLPWDVDDCVFTSLEFTTPTTTAVTCDSGPSSIAMLGGGGVFTVSR